MTAPKQAHRVVIARKKPVVIETMRFEILDDGGEYGIRGSLASANSIREWTGGKAYSILPSSCDDLKNYTDGAMAEILKLLQLDKEAE